MSVLADQTLGKYCYQYEQKVMWTLENFLRFTEDLNLCVSLNVKEKNKKRSLRGYIKAKYKMEQDPGALLREHIFLPTQLEVAFPLCHHVFMDFIGLDQRSANYYPQAKSTQLFLYIKFCWSITMLICLYITYFQAIVAKLNNFYRKCTACKAKDIYCLLFYRRTLLTMAQTVMKIILKCFSSYFPFLPLPVPSIPLAIYELLSVFQVSAF